MYRWEPTGVMDMLWVVEVVHRDPVVLPPPTPLLAPSGTEEVPGQLRRGAAPAGAPASSQGHVKVTGWSSTPLGGLKLCVSLPIAASIKLSFFFEKGRKYINHATNHHRMFSLWLAPNMKMTIINTSGKTCLIKTCVELVITVASNASSSNSNY